LLVARHNIYVARYGPLNRQGRGIKYSEFKRWLEQQGAIFKKHRSGSSHYRVTLNGLTTIFPHHGSKEMGRDLDMRIRKQLGLK
jgi:mRNA interferase HicA